MLPCCPPPPPQALRHLRRARLWELGVGTGGLSPCGRCCLWAGLNDYSVVQVHGQGLRTSSVRSRIPLVVMVSFRLISRGPVCNTAATKTHPAPSCTGGRPRGLDGLPAAPGSPPQAAMEPLTVTLPPAAKPRGECGVPRSHPDVWGAPCWSARLLIDHFQRGLRSCPCSWVTSGLPRILRLSSQRCWRGSVLPPAPPSRNVCPLPSGVSLCFRTFTAVRTPDPPLHKRMRAGHGGLPCAQARSPRQQNFILA